MPRFVLLHHLCPPSYERPSHWDLMLEMQGVLRTWALDDPLTNAVPITTKAQPLVDHRLAFLEFEGPLGDDRGAVRQVERGIYKLFGEDTDYVRFRLSGRNLAGMVEIRLQSAKDPYWRLDWFPEADC